MKNRTSIILSIAFLSFCAMPMQGQGLSGFLKKAAQALTTPSNSSNTSTSQNTNTVSAAEEQIATGGTLVNPLKDKVQVELVGAYGKSTSENYGEISLVFKIKMIANTNEMRIGCNANWPAMLIDDDGNVSKVRTEGWYDYTVTEGIFMKVPLKDEQTFTNVRKSCKVIQKAQIALSVDRTGMLVLKNVPVQWDVQH